MLRIGLTGGIGAGKSAVAHRLAEHGAIVVDSDRIAREVVEPGTPGLAAVVAEFGAEVLRADGSLDRDRLGALVFGDDAARSRLNAIVHPLVGRRAAELAAAAPEGAVLVHDIPLLVENNLAAGFDLVLVVEAPVELRVARLVRDRGMTEEAARARIAAQASDAERRAVADVLLHNDGTLAELREQVDKVWAEIEARRAAG
jgi:dephospho-CoA kinase